MWIYLLGPLAGGIIAPFGVRALGGRATGNERDAALGDQLR
jgi:hypothetical protein